MKEKRLKKLNRRKLLELLVEQMEENQGLRERMGAEPEDGAFILQLETQRKQEQYQKRYRSVLRSTVFTLITVAAASVLVATLWMPVLRISGNSMTPTLTDGEIVLAVKNAQLEPGDIVAFYYNNKILIKRVICNSGDWVNITEDGTVYVNQIEIPEPYLTERALGDCDIEFPYQVPDGKIFVMGDHRATSVDSRNTMVGCVAQEQIVGKIFFRIWPLNQVEHMR